MSLANILVVTPLFPALDVYQERAADPRTKFLYDYAVEWTKLGHRVSVLHVPPRYPGWFAPALPWLERLPGIARLHLRRFLQNPAAVSESSYDFQGIQVVRLPVAKHFPHRDYSSRTTDKLIRRAQEVVAAWDRHWDLILADFLSPSLAIASALGEDRAGKICQILHETDLRYYHIHQNRMRSRLGRLDGIFFRSHALQRKFSRMGVRPQNAHFMWSGIPATVALGQPRHRIRRLLYVGSLIPRKRVHLLLKAMASLSPGYGLMLDIVGEGSCESELRRQSQTLGLGNRVQFRGRYNRDQVFAAMRQADALVMVSVDTFGMTYIEAMSQGCIPVAARDQGMDGIVIDGQNGFLVELDNVAALARTLERLALLDETDAVRLSGRALQTAAGMRDDLLACRLIEKALAPSGTA